MQQIQSQEQWVLYRLEKFYGNPDNLSKVRDILNGTSKISLGTCRGEAPSRIRFLISFFV
jgi:hypothetical protein